MVRLPGHEHFQGAVHIRAHLSKRQKDQLQGNEIHFSRLNDQVDLDAKERAAELKLVPEINSRHSRQRNQARAVIRTIAATVLVFPKPEKYDRMMPILTLEERNALRERRRKNEGAKTCSRPDKEMACLGHGRTTQVEVCGVPGSKMASQATMQRGIVYPRQRIACTQGKQRKHRARLVGTEVAQETWNWDPGEARSSSPGMVQKVWFLQRGQVSQPGRF